MRIDKTYSELWNLVHKHEDNAVRETAQMAINALQKLEEQNIHLKEISKNRNVEFEAYRKCVRGEY